MLLLVLLMHPSYHQWYYLHYCGVLFLTTTVGMIQELAHEEVVRSVKLEQAKEVTKLRQEVEQAANELASKYERKMKVR